MISHSKPAISNKEISAVNQVLRSGFLSSGKICRKFEQAFCRYSGLAFAASVNSGTSALHLSLLALKIKSGDEVIIPSYVCTAVLNSLIYVGATPKIADINERDFNISPESVKNKLGRRTKAIIVPHMFGEAADMDELLKLGLPIIEDCALSIGAKYKNRLVGTFGEIAVFSFYATKMLTSAEGGMIATNKRSLFNFVQDLKDYDNKDGYRLRYNYKLSDLNASLGLEQLKKLPEFISHRQKIARVYNTILADLGIQLPCLEADKTHVYFRYVLKVANIASVMDKLSRRGIEAKRPIFKPLHRYLGLKDRDFPVATSIYKRSLSLPIYPRLSIEQARKIASALRSSLGK